MPGEPLQRWALLAEVAGAVAVVVTLVFVVVEMRENTNALQAQTYQELMQELNDYRALLLNNTQRYALEERMRTEGWHNLTRAEQQTLRIPSLIVWGIYESAYFANERGVLGEREWTRFEESICRATTSQAEYWDPGGITAMPELLTPEFVAYVGSSC